MYHKVVRALRFLIFIRVCLRLSILFITKPYYIISVHSKTVFTLNINNKIQFKYHSFNCISLKFYLGGKLIN